MISAIVVTLDEGGDGGLKFTLQIVVFHQGVTGEDLIWAIKIPVNVLEGLVPELDLALRLGVIGRASHMIHAVLIKLFCEIPRNVTKAAIAEQQRLVQHGEAVTS